MLQRKEALEAGQGARGARLLMIEAPYYAAITAALAAGAEAAVHAADCTLDRITVPGALEIPQALMLTATLGKFGHPASSTGYQGAIVIGCVIRGETTHYDTVCDVANHGLMQVAIAHQLVVGNAILTVENEAQAWARAEGGINNKGGDAARAALRLIEIARGFSAAQSTVLS